MLQVATQPNIAQLVTPQPPSESLATAHSQQCIQLDPYSVAQQPTTAQNVDPSPGPQNTAPPGNTQAAPVIVPVHEIILAKQLAHLASQHHASEYNRLKYGAKGSPYAYVPLSLQLPDHVQKLQEQQAIHAQQKAWWPSDQESQHPTQRKANSNSYAPGSLRGRVVNVAESSAEKPVSSLPALVTSRPDWQQELSAAIASTLPGSGSIHQTKTSETHPINISMVVPFEHLPTLSSYLSKAPEDAPVMFQLPGHCHLDRVTAVPIPGAHTFLPHYRQHYQYPSKPRMVNALPNQMSQPYATSTNQHPPIHALGNDVVDLQQDQAHVLNAGMSLQPPLNGFHKERPNVPPLFVPSQKPNLIGTVMTGSPPVPIADLEITPTPTPTSTNSALQAHAGAMARLAPAPLPAQTPSSIQPPSPPTGVIRRPRHKRASSAPPDMATLRIASNGALGTVARLRSARSDSAQDGTRGVKTIPRNRSFDATCTTPASPFLLTPPMFVPSSIPPPGLQASGSVQVHSQQTVQPLQLVMNNHTQAFSHPPSSFHPFPQPTTSSSQRVLSTQTGSPVSTSPVSASTSASGSPLTLTSLTQNPAFIKRPSVNGTYVVSTGIVNGSAFIAPLSPYIGSRGSKAVAISTYPGLTNGDASLPRITKLGNMFLSSCPGKKVRLSGPVKGRGAICRDLRQDLSRVKELGVRCIVCCLDDSELDYLGASWAEYSRVANDLGLDVLRLPTPEGLAPLTPSLLDTHLIRIIESYTLRGVPILAHCRGGVGRAGLVACCWLLKLGLVGWKDPAACTCLGGCRISGPGSGVKATAGSSSITEAMDIGADTVALCGCGCGRLLEHAHKEEGHGSEQSHSNGVPHTESPQPEHHSTHSSAQSHSTQSIISPLHLHPRRRPRPACRATIQLIERAIAVVRRRRSLKAVETYEQVKFLVDFVEYLEVTADTRVLGRASSGAKEVHEPNNNAKDDVAMPTGSTSEVCDVD